MKNYTKEAYDQVMELRLQNLGAIKISKILETPKGTIDGWLYKGAKPRMLSEKYKKAQNENKKNLKMGRGWNKKKLPKHSKKLSVDLAYICGVILGDGYLRIRGVELLVKDKDFANKFSSSLKRWSTLSPKVYLTKRGYFSVCLCSTEVGNFLSKNINKLVEKIMEVSDEKVICAFIKGIFDSEGSISYDRKNGKADLKMGMTNKKVAKCAKYLLFKTGISSSFYKRTRKNKKWKTFYTVSIQKRKMQKLFFQKIGFSIKRKQKLLKEVCEAEVLLREDIPLHVWYRKGELEFIKKHYGLVSAKEFVNILNNKYWTGKNVRTVKGLYTKISDMRKVYDK